MDTPGGDQNKPLKGDQAETAQTQPQSPAQPPSDAKAMEGREAMGDKQVGRPFDIASTDAKAMADRQGKPAGAKEEEFVGQVGVSERVPIVEQREPRELPEEVEGWLERVERDDVVQPQPIVHQGKTVVSPAAPQDVKVTLPLTEDDVKQGIHHKLFESVRWLAEWCVRLAKKYHGKVAYKIQSKSEG